jgi:DNA-binding NtrC family response regulator
MPNFSGIELLKQVKKLYPDTLVVVITAHSTIKTAIEAMKHGAYDYLQKPLSEDELSVKMNRWFEYIQEKRENSILRQELNSRYQYASIIGKSSTMQRVFEKIKMVADSPTAVLIQGSSGTGKELVAKAIHHNSSRKNHPFVQAHCAIFNQGVLESELFGHEKGAFTGATRKKAGRFELANNGTIFLDDVDDISLETQVKLLRILQEKQFERIGGEKTISLDVRVIAATKKDLRVLVDEGKFREDLYFRLKVVPILLPALKERKEDIPILVKHFLQKYDMNKKIDHEDLSEEILQFISNYDWPGNVRELEHAVEHTVVFCPGGRMEVKHFPEDIISQVQEKAPVFKIETESGTVDLGDALREYEASLLRWAWKKCDGHQSKMAKCLNIPRTTLRDKLIKHALIAAKK